MITPTYGIPGFQKDPPPTKVDFCLIKPGGLLCRNRVCTSGEGIYVTISQANRQKKLPALLRANSDQNVDNQCLTASSTSNQNKKPNRHLYTFERLYT